MGNDHLSSNWAAHSARRPCASAVPFRTGSGHCRIVRCDSSIAHHHRLGNPGVRNPSNRHEQLDLSRSCARRPRIPRCARKRARSLRCLGRSLHHCDEWKPETPMERPLTEWATPISALVITRQVRRQILGRRVHIALRLLRHASPKSAIAHPTPAATRLPD